MARNDVIRVLAPNTTKAEKERREQIAREAREQAIPRIGWAEPNAEPRYREVPSIVTGLGRAGTGIMKALDFPNRLFGNTRSRLQDAYERADRNIELTRKKDPSIVDRVVETAGTLAGSAWSGPGLPLLFGAAGGTEVIDAAERSGVDNAGERGARAATVDTGIWSAALNLGTKALPTHLKWLGPYVAGMVKSVASSAARSAEYKDLGYDVSMESNVIESLKMAALMPLVAGAVKDIGAQSYKVPGTGRQVKLTEFANKFQSRIKQSDRTTADAERIANEYIEMVENDPGSFVPKVSPEGKALQKFTGLLVQPFRNGHAEGHARMVDPEGKTGADAEAWANDDVKSWYQLYKRTLSENEIRTLRELTGKDKLTPDEKAKMTELITRPARSDAHVTGMDPRTGQYVDQTIGDFLGGLAEMDSSSRAESIGTLASFLKTADHYSPTEKALVLQAASTYGVRSGKNGRQLVSMDTTNTQQPTIIDDAAVSTIVSQLRDGVPIKKALLAEPVASQAVGKRGVPANYTGWKRFDKSSKPEDIAALQAACAGSKGRWCTGEGAAGSQLPYGDFHVHFTGGEPDVAIRMTGNTVNEVRGSDTGQRLFPKEAEIAEDYIREQQASGYPMDIDKGFWADQAFRRKLATDSVTWRDVWEIDLKKPSFAGAAGEMGAEESWPPYAQEVIWKTLRDSRNERNSAGYFTENELSGGNVIDPRVRHLKGNGLTLGYPGSEYTLDNFPNLQTVDRSASIFVDSATKFPEGLHDVGGSLTLYEGASAPGVTSVGGDLNLGGGASAPGVTSVGRDLSLYEGASAPGVTSVGRDLNLYKGASAPGVTSVGGDLNLGGGASAPGVTSVGGDLTLGIGESAPPGLTSVGGSLTLHEGASAPRVTSVGGDLVLGRGTSAPGVTSVGGDLRLNKGTSAPGVTSVGGNLILDEDTSAPAGLTSVGRDLFLYEGASAPGVTSVGRDLSLYEGASAPGVTSVGRDLSLYKGASAPGVTSVGGSLTLYEGASAPGVTSVGGDLNLGGGASAPGVTSVGRDLSLYEGASAPGVTSVGRSLTLHEGASAPGVTSVGGDLVLGRGTSAPGVTSVGGDLILGRGASAPGVTSVGRDLKLYKGASVPGVTSVVRDLNLYEDATTPKGLTSVGGVLYLGKGASAPGVTSVGWLPYKPDNTPFDIVPKYGYYDARDGSLVNKAGEPLTLLNHEKTNENLPDYVRRLTDPAVWNGLYRDVRRRAIEDLVNGYHPDSLEERELYDNMWTDGQMPTEPFPNEPFPNEPFLNEPFPNEPFPNEPFPNEPFPDDLPFALKAGETREDARVSQSTRAAAKGGDASDGKRESTAPTDEQLKEAAAFLRLVVERGFAKTDDEIEKCERLARAIEAAIGAEPVEPREEPLRQAPLQGPETQAAYDAGETEEEALKRLAEGDIGKTLQEDMSTLEEREKFLEERGMDKSLAETGSMDTLVKMHEQETQGSTGIQQGTEPQQDMSAFANGRGVTETTEKDVQDFVANAEPQQDMSTFANGKGVTETTEKDVQDFVANAEPRQADAQTQQETLAPGLSMGGSRNNILEYEGRRISQREFDRIQARFQEGGPERPTGVGGRELTAGEAAWQARRQATTERWMERTGWNAVADAGLPEAQPNQFAAVDEGPAKPNGLFQNTQVDSGRRDALGRPLDRYGRVIA